MYKLSKDGITSITIIRKEREVSYNNIWRALASGVERSQYREVYDDCFSWLIDTCKALDRGYKVTTNGYKQVLRIELLGKSFNLHDFKCYLEVNS